MTRFVALGLAATLLFSCQKPEAPVSSGFSGNIITRDGDRLMDGDREFRFMSLAAPNIQQNESQIRADRSNRFPDEYEIRDILGGLQRIGGTVTRTFSLSIHHPDDGGMPVYIPARRTYNEEAFQTLDRILALAPEYNVRLIIPIIASQSFGGIRGVDEFAALSGKPKGSFWTDEEVKADYKHLLEFLLLRTNTITGVQYKDDPAILAWQLGNEFSSYAGDRGLSWDEWSPKILAWSLEMASYMKELDPNHLIMEAGGADRQHYIDAPQIDLISEHLYEYWNKQAGRPWQLAPFAREARAQTKGKKPLLVDEFGLGSTENLRELMTVIREEGISGGLMWSIRGHRRDGGWYYHNEGGTYVNSFHVPGFAAGFAYEEQRLLDLIKAEAYAIRGFDIPPTRYPTPEPVLFRHKDGFTWRGSTGAAYYVMERAPAASGPWTVIAGRLDDSVIHDVKSFEYSEQASEPLVLYHDETARKGSTWVYRIRGVNEAGSTAPSNLIEITHE